MRQLGRPALLAAMYSGDGPGAAAAAMAEVEGVLVSSLHELERGNAGSAGAGIIHSHERIVSLCNTRRMVPVDVLKMRQACRGAAAALRVMLARHFPTSAPQPCPSPLFRFDLC